MAVQRRSELGLAAQWQTLRLTDGGNQPVHSASPAPVSCHDAASFDTNLYFIVYRTSRSLLFNRCYSYYRNVAEF